MQIEVQIGGSIASNGGAIRISGTSGSTEDFNHGVLIQGSGSLDSGGVCSDSGFGGDGLLSLSIGSAGADFKSVASILPEPTFGILNTPWAPPL